METTVQNSTIHFFSVLWFFAFSILWSFFGLWFFIYLVLWIWSTNPALSKPVVTILVVYFDHFFFSRFQPFFLFSNVFHWLFWLKSRKTVKTVWKKLCFKLLFKADRHANAGRLPWGVPQICIFWFIFWPFWTFFMSRPAFAC